MRSRAQVCEADLRERRGKYAIPAVTWKVPSSLNIAKACSWKRGTSGGIEYCDVLMSKSSEAVAQEGQRLGKWEGLRAQRPLEMKPSPLFRPLS